MTQFVRAYPCGCEAFEGASGLYVHTCTTHSGRVLWLLDSEIRAENPPEMEPNRDVSA